MFAARDVESGAEWALKTMTSRGARQLLRFKREFREIADLHHPNLVRLIDLHATGERWFFTMERIHGAPLHVLLGHDDGEPTEGSATLPHSIEGGRAEPPGPRDTDPRPPSRSDPSLLTSVVRQLTEGLSYLHANGVVHGDLKPSNVLLSSDGQVKILDFGLVRLMREAGGAHPGGTPGFMAPELPDTGPTEATDLYALGALLFTLLTGHRPPVRAPSGAAPAPDRYVSGLAPAWVRVCTQLLSHTPEARPSLVQVRAAVGLEAPTAPPMRPVFIGHDHAMQTLRDVARDARAACQFVVVSGDSGIGKSALAARLAQSLAPEWLAFSGRGHRDERVPFAALDRLVDAIALELEARPPAGSSPLARDIAALAASFPVLAMLPYGVAPRAETGDIQVDAARRIQPLARVICALAADRPVVLIIDDVQWLGADTVAALRVVLAELSRGVMVVLLVRSEDCGADAIIDDLALASRGWRLRRPESSWPPSRPLTWSPWRTRGQRGP